MAFDIDYACYQAVAGISAYAPAMALVKPPCFVFQTQDEFIAKKQIYRVPNDFPQIRVELRQAFQWATNSPRTFCMMSTSYSPTAHADFGIPGTLQILMTLVHRDAKLTVQTPLELVARKYLASKWPTLGVVDTSSRVVVNGYGVIGNRRDEATETTGNAIRTVTRLAINITARPRLSQLTA